MASVNKVILIGNLGRDPEIRYTQSGEPIANFSIATNEVWNDRSGQKQERTEWHRVVLFGKVAEIAAQFLKKGSLVYLQGRLQTRKWQGDDGQDRYTTEIVADHMKMLGGKGEREGQPGTAAASARTFPAQPFDDDIPF